MDCVTVSSSPTMRETSSLSISTLPEPVIFTRMAASWAGLSIWRAAAYALIHRPRKWLNQNVHSLFISFYMLITTTCHSIESTNLGKCTKPSPCLAELAALTLWIFPHCTSFIPSTTSSSACQLLDQWVI